MRRVQVLSPASPLDVEHVVDRLRPDDVAEALAFGLDPVRGPQTTFEFATDSHVATVDGEPTFVFGSIQLLPGVRQVFGFGTPRTYRAMPEITRYGHRVWTSQLVDAGVRRLQVQVPVSSRHSMRWLDKVGFKHEFTMPNYAVDGGAVAQLVYSREDLVLCAFSAAVAAR